MHQMKDIPEVSEEHQASRGAGKLQNSIRRKAVQSILGTKKKATTNFALINVYIPASPQKNFTFIFKNFKFPFMGEQ